MTTEDILSHLLFVDLFVCEHIFVDVAESRVGSPCAVSCADVMDVCQSCWLYKSEFTMAACTSVVPHS